MSKILDYVVDKKKTVFLINCMYVHVSSFFYFLFYGAYTLCWINAVSIVIYVFLMLYAKRNSDRVMAISHIEIIVFSIICEMMTEGNFGFLFFTLSMVAVIFCLPDISKSKKLFLQFLAVLGTFTIFFLSTFKVCPLPDFRINMDAQKDFILFWNIWAAMGNIIFVSFIFMAEQEKNKSALEYNMNHDQLTGLYNRRFLYSALDSTNHTLPVYSIAMVDLDDFKRINDTYGHEIGDRVLVALSDILKTSVGPDDILVRWGGEEFIVYMPGTDKDAGYEKLSEILNRIREYRLIESDEAISFTATMGLATGTSLNNYEQLIDEADQKLYYGKKNGKNRIVI